MFTSLLYLLLLFFYFFYYVPAPTEIYTLSLHDALPILLLRVSLPVSLRRVVDRAPPPPADVGAAAPAPRSEEHTSELQSHSDLVCRLLLEKKKKQRHTDA